MKCVCCVNGEVECPAGCSGGVIETAVGDADHSVGCRRCDGRGRVWCDACDGEGHVAAPRVAIREHRWVRVGRGRKRCVRCESEHRVLDDGAAFYVRPDGARVDHEPRCVAKSGDLASRSAAVAA